MNISWELKNIHIFHDMAFTTQALKHIFHHYYITKFTLDRNVNFLHDMYTCNHRSYKINGVITHTSEQLNSNLFSHAEMYQYIL